ncbi:hypothetical protein LY474_28680 [Myxococcus stipitatus]|uniref:hypothetical protein n=1 Tax=Myxococcus stipitatus TaxID=83455 RepID=UPI001F43DF94|nr:hypothetical protein [Myxococcus stipitatus]MCE9671791.1 hypothetical protein [Myxococcus stipitatus]
MSVEERVVKWLKDGRQVGKRYSFVRDGETFWGALAIQRVDDAYTAVFWEVAESVMWMEEEHRRERASFDTVAGALAFLEGRTGRAVDDLAPLKGARVFKP